MQRVQEEEGHAAGGAERVPQQLAQPSREAADQTGPAAFLSLTLTGVPQALSPIARDCLKAEDPHKRCLSSMSCSLMPVLVQGTPSLPSPAPQPLKEGIFWAQVLLDRRGQSSPCDTS